MKPDASQPRPETKTDWRESKVSKVHLQRDEQLFRRAIGRARRIRHRGAEAFALDRYLHFLGEIGRYDEALRDAPRLIETYGAEGAVFQQALTITSVGRCWAARAGQLDDSLSYARRFTAMADEQGDTSPASVVRDEWRTVLLPRTMGRGDQRRRETLPLAWQIAEYSPIVFGSAWRGLALLKLGRLDEARRVLDRALTFATSRRRLVPSLAYITQARALCTSQTRARQCADLRTQGFRVRGREPLPTGARRGEAGARPSTGSSRRTRARWRRANP